MLRISPGWFCSLCFGLLLANHGPVLAQPASSLANSWTLGTSVQAVAMEGVPIATGTGLSATWQRTSNWGFQIGVRRDAAVQRDLREAYRTDLDWANQRRTSVTPALVWKPTDADGGVSQSFQLSLGPTLQVQRGEQVRTLGAVNGEFSISRILDDPRYEADNAYLDRTRTTALLLLTDDTDRTNVGATLGIQYGLTYKLVTVRAALFGRKVTNIDGVTFGVGGTVGVML